MTNIAIASTCFIMLILFNVIGGLIMEDINDDRQTNTDTTGLESIDDIEQDGIGITSLLGIGSTILKVVVWNTDFNLFINLLLTIIKVLLILSLGDMIWIG